MDNRELCERYPFLLPRNWEDKVPKGYDYSYTKLDEIPVGWKIAFGEQMCADIMEILEEEFIDDFQILQIKEKFGELRVYYAPYSQKIEDIIHKYAEMSKKTCLVCGKPTIRDSVGWVILYCDDCARKNKWHPYF